jgi:cation/acetate symporter
MAKGDFTQNMRRVVFIYTGGCAVLGTVLVVLDLAGLPHKVTGIGFVVLTVGFYALMGLLSRSGLPADYTVADRRVPPLYNGMATAANWMSAASFIGLAGAIYAAGFDGLAFVLGWTGGYVLLAALLAPYLRKCGVHTVSDFLAARYGGTAPRVISVVVLLSASFSYVVAQIYGTGIIAARYLGIDFHLAVFVGLAGILLCSLLGGLRALIWTQVAQYVVVVFAYLLPAVILSTRTTGVPLPQIMYGEALHRLAALAGQLGASPTALAPANGIDAVNFFALTLCLMLGTAASPHVLSRFFTTPSVREARISVAWSLLFILLLYTTAPAYAAFAKLEIYQRIADGSLTPATDWVAQWSRIDLLHIGSARWPLQVAQFHLDPDALVLATPEIAGMPFFVAGLVAAGALAASLSSADGLLLSMANAVSHDIYFRILAPGANPRQRLALARGVMVVVALAAAWVASMRPADIVTVVSWAFSLAASGLFPALVLGIWWKRTAARGAACGIAAGWLVCLFYIVAVRGFGLTPWLGVRDLAAGLFGVPVAAVVTVVISLLGPPPSREIEEFVDSIRTPRGPVRLAAGQRD